MQCSVHFIPSSVRPITVIHCYCSRSFVCCTLIFSSPFLVPLLECHSDGWLMPSYSGNFVELHANTSVIDGDAAVVFFAAHAVTICLSQCVCAVHCAPTCTIYAGELLAFFFLPPTYRQACTGKFYTKTQMRPFLIYAPNCDLNLSSGMYRQKTNISSAFNYNR